MSKKHPVIAVTGSSGAGTSSVKDAFAHMFRREGVKAAFIEGDSFHRYNLVEMLQVMADKVAGGDPNFSHFGPEANLLKQLGDLFQEYGRTGSGRRRYYIHNEIEAKEFAAYGVRAGEFTPWEDLPADTDLLFYEGLHGCLADGQWGIAENVDLRIGVVPVINLEWIQKIHRDTRQRGYSEEAVMDTILRRMHDYVHYIVPQFKRTDINFQRVPVVDTSDPIIARDIPTPDESLVVIRFRKPEALPVDFPYLLSMIKDSWMSRRNTIVVPGGRMSLAIELVMTPILRKMIDEKRKALEGGNGASREYLTTPLPGVLAAVVRDDRLLLIERGKEPDKGKWGLPGGLVEEGETIIEAAQRELMEETGIEGENGRVIDRFVMRSEDGKFNYSLTVVRLDWVEGEAVAASDAAAAGWFSLHQIADLPKSPDLPRLAQMLLD